MPQEKTTKHPEEGVEVPYSQINPDTLNRLIQDFVARDGVDWADAGCTLEEKVEQVLQQLKNRKVKIVFDLRTQTANIVSCRQEFS